MRRDRAWTAALLGAAALLLLPAVGSAQFRTGMGRYGVSAGAPFYGSWPSSYYYGIPSNYNYGFYPYAWGWSPAAMNSYSPGAYTAGNYAPPSVYSNDSYFNRSTVTDYATRPNSGGYYSYGTPSRPQEGNTVRLDIRLPDPDAQVWIEGKLTQQRGTSREFVSPPLSPDKNYTYEVRARWTENGRDVERTQTVPVKANGAATVDFNKADSGKHSRVDDIEHGTTRPADKTAPREAPRPDRP